jgi:hypothetical protein
MCGAPSSLGASCYCAPCSQTRATDVVKAEYGLGQPIPSGSLTCSFNWNSEMTGCKYTKDCHWQRRAPRRMHKCDRKGRYHVHKLIEKQGRKGNLMKWRETELDSRPAAPILSVCCKGITGKSWSHYGCATVPCITSQAATSCPTNSATN